MAALDRGLYSDLIGKRFVCNGRGPDVYDCYGIIVEIARRRGILVPDFQYGQDIEERRTMFDLHLSHWTLCEIEPGAALAFQTGGRVVHCGVAIDPFRFVHASETIGSVVISKLDDRLAGFGRRYAGAYRYAV